ncbi:MAG: hypothetical protein QXI12_13245 [Candidatus Methanomethyliaceae archaeon]
MSTIELWNANPSLKMPVPGEREPDELVKICLSRPSCARLLHALASRPNTFMTLPDLAAYARCDESEAESAMRQLEQSGLIRRLEVGGFRFYALSEDPSSRAVVSRFRTWCEDQRNRWRAVQEFLACA